MIAGAQRHKTKHEVERQARAVAKTFTIEPSADNVIIKRLEANLTDSGLVLVKTEQKFIPSNLGLVMSVGPGKFDGGVYVPTKLKAGDKVWFHLFPSGCEVQEERDQNETYIIIAEKQCVGIVRKAKKGK